MLVMVLQIKNTILNENYFNEKSRNMFYVLGFWCADGCICSSGGNKCFNIHIKTMINIY